MFAPDPIIDRLVRTLPNNYAINKSEIDAIMSLISQKDEGQSVLDKLKEITSKGEVISKILSTRKRYDRTESELMKLLTAPRIEFENSMTSSIRSWFLQSAMRSRHKNFGIGIPSSGNTPRRENHSLSALGQFYRLQEQYPSVLAYEDESYRHRENHSLDSINKFYRLQEQYQELNRRGRSRIPYQHDRDSWQYALGRDTGVRDDFSYLREEEEEQTRRRIRRNRVARSEYVASLRKYPWMKTLSDIHVLGKSINIISKKNFPKMAKSLDKMSKGSPILSHFLKNPVSTAAGAAWAGMTWLFNQSDRANQEVVNWQNAANLSGKPSSEFSRAAALAGVKDPGEMARRYGKATLKFGNADAVYKILGANVANLPPIARMAIAAELGLDETDMALMDILSNNGRIKIDDARRVNTNRNAVNVRKTLGLSSSGSFGETLDALWLSIPGMGGANARDAANYGRNYEDMYLMGDMSKINSAIKDSEAAASSSEASDKSGSSILNNTTSQSNSRRFDISNVYVTANNADELMESIEREASSISYDDMLSAADRMDSGALA